MPENNCSCALQHYGVIDRVAVTPEGNFECPRILRILHVDPILRAGDTVMRYGVSIDFVRRRLSRLYRYTLVLRPSGWDTGINDIPLGVQVHMGKDRRAMHLFLVEDVSEREVEDDCSIEDMAHEC
jgi:hypothetical protein